MKQHIISQLLYLLLLAAVCCPAVAEAATPSFVQQTVYVVRVGGYDGVETVKTMSRKQYNALNRQISREKLLASRAHSMAEAKWNAAEEGKYPGRGFSRRSATKIMTCKTQADADKRIKKMKDSQATFAAKVKRNEAKLTSKGSKGSKKGKGGSSELQRLVNFKNKSKAHKAKSKALLKKAESYYQAAIKEVAGG